MKKEAKASKSAGKESSKERMRLRQLIVTAQGHLNADAKWEDICAQQSLASSRQVLAAKALYDKKQEDKILKEETSRQATTKASKAHRTELATRITYTDATSHINQLATFVHASEGKANDVKAGIYVELLSHKEAMAQARSALTARTAEKARALRYAAMKVLEVDMLAAKHTAAEFKGLKKREAAMRRKAKTAEKRAMKLRSAGAQSKKLFKAEEKAEMKAQLKEFKDARNKVLHSKGKVTMGEVQKDEQALGDDSKKLAVAKAMQKSSQEGKATPGTPDTGGLRCCDPIHVGCKGRESSLPSLYSKGDADREGRTAEQGAFSRIDSEAQVGIQGSKSHRTRVGGDQA